MNTQINLTLAPVYFAVPQTHLSMWAAPVQGIRMSVPASQLGTVAGMSTATCSATANAAKGATRKDATGDEAFEDPV